MKPDDTVLVTNLDGDTAEGRVVDILEATIDEYEADFVSLDGATLFDVWRGEDVDPDDRVVQVDLGTGVYDYPESKVELVA